MTLSQRFRPVFVAIAMLLAAAGAAMAQTRVSMTATPTAAVLGQTVTFRAVVTVNGVPATTGHIFLTGSGGADDVISMASPDAAGGATFGTHSLAIGRHELTARYNPTGTTVHSALPASLLVAVTVGAPGPFGNFTMAVPFDDACTGASAVADLNGDGKLDVASACRDTNQVRIRIGNGDGTFQPANALATGVHMPLDIAAGDLNVDGRKDIILLGAANGLWGQASISSFRNLGGATFDAPVVTSFAPQMTSTIGNSLAVIDLDGTRVPDVAFTVGAGLVAASGSSTGAFTQRFTTNLFPEIASLAAGDLNGDGYHDLAVTATEYVGAELVDLLSVFKGDGAYGFTVTASSVVLPGAQGDLVIGDFDGDGRGDVVSTLGQMWPGQADGSIGAPQLIPAVGGFHLGAGEFNGDGVLDLVTPALTLLPGLVAGGFGAATALQLEPGSPLAIGDVNDDGRLDLVVQSGVALGGREASLTLTVQQDPSPGQPYAVHADIAGAVGPATGGTVLFRLGGGPVVGTAPVDGSGHATLSPVNWGPMGTWSMIAEFSGDANYGRAWDVKPVTIAATSSNMTLTVSPGSPVHGESIYITTFVASQGPLYPTGTITISVNGLVVASGNPQYLQHAVALTTGEHTITASYAGDARFAPVTMSQEITVGPGRTRTVLAASGGTIGVGWSIALTATVSVLAPANVPVTGSVVFTDGGQALATVPMEAGGTATFAAPITTPGLHHIRAEFVPDTPALLGSQSAAAAYSAITAGAGGGLRRAVDFPTAGADGFVRLGDLNGDSRLDAVVAQGTVMSVFFGNGDATFQPRVDYTMPDAAVELAVMDVNGDGHVDVFVPLAATATNAAVIAFYGDGTGAFPQVFETATSGKFTIAAAIGELTDNQFPDIAAAMRNDLLQPSTVGIVDVTNAGQPLSGLQGPFSLPAAVAIGDITGDGHNDVVVADRDSLIMIVWGQVLRQQIQLDVHPTAVTLADLNHDGRADVVVGARTYLKRMAMLADGTGSFGAPVWIDEGAAPDPIVADIDADGNPDLLELTGSQLIVLRGHGDGTFATRRVYGLAPGTTAAIADLNGDGLMDVVAAGEALHVMAGAAGVNMTVTSNLAHDLPARTPVTVTASIAALNASDGTPPGPVRFHARSVTPDLSREWTAEVMPVDGVATFTNVYPWGWLTITAEYDGDATFGANGGTVEHFVAFSTEAPVFAPIADVTVETDDAAGAMVAYPLPQATDSAGNTLAVTCSPLSGTQFPVGDTTVACSATDVDGNSASGAFTVAVTLAAPPENTAPALTLPGPIVVEADRKRGAPVTYTVTAVDAEDGALTPRCVRASGRVFPVGTTTVSCAAKDSEGLVATGSFTVTVRDTTAPVITYKGNRGTYDAHQNVNIRCVAKDPVSGIASSTCADTTAKAYTFAVGLNTLAATATDGAGNTGQATASFTVVVTTQSLKSLVRDFSTVATVTKALIAKLNANNLAAFRTQVQAESGLAMTAEQATILLRLTQ